jgi:hypothetical protein
MRGWDYSIHNQNLYSFYFRQRRACFRCHKEEEIESEQLEHLIDLQSSLLKEFIMPNGCENKWLWLLKKLWHLVDLFQNQIFQSPKFQPILIEAMKKSSEEK